MKKLFTILVVVLLTASLFAQAPEKTSYQAVIRNSSNALVTNTQIGMQISILQGSTSGTAVYVETQTPTTNANGLVSIEIGGGTVVSGNFSSIEWANGPYFIKTETDPTGGSTYTIIGTSQLLSVPYALYSKTAENVLGKITELDPVYNSSVASSITEKDTASWNKKIDSYTETQNIADVAAINNSVNAQIKNLKDPTDPQDAVTKAYVDLLMERIEILVGRIVKDIDGNIYQTVKIGTQIWMAENLKVTHYPDGSPIDYISGDVNWNALTASSKAYCWYNDQIGNKDIYGALYTWSAVMNDSPSSSTNPSGVQGVCPSDWHVPSDAEWTQLTDYLGGTSIAGGKLKEIGTTHWNSPNSGATDEYGFKALPSGYRYSENGASEWLGNIAYWWTSTIYAGEMAYPRDVNYSTGGIYRNYDWKMTGYSVRCVKD